MSALSNLAGLYPPKGNQVWNPDLLWQPIPVHTRALADDALLSSHADCPRFKQIYEELMESKEIQGIFIIPYCN
jgi:prostatic aicd phosphatase